MQKFVFTLMLSWCFYFISAQQVSKIEYQETIKLDIQIEGLDESMLDLIPKSQDIKKQLLFNSTTSLYTNYKGESLEDTELESDDGNFKIVIMHDDTEELLYQNFADKKQIHQKGIMGKSFIVEDELPKRKWKMTNEKVKYLDYECTKAVSETEDEFIVAWFTSEIPGQAGPSGFCGLPGTVLMVNVDDGKLEIKATKVDLDAMENTAIKIPDDGKKVTEEEFEKIRKEKEEELQNSFKQR